MAYASSECPGSLRPAPPFRPGDHVACQFCHRNCEVVGAPLAGLHDPWFGSKDGRIEPHRFERAPHLGK